MAIFLKFGNSYERLAHNLAVTSSGKKNPFEKTVCVVPGNGLRRWLTLEIAKEKGICANWSFPTISQLVESLFKEQTGSDVTLATRDCLFWNIYTTLNQYSDSPEFPSSIQKYLQKSPPVYTFQLAEKCASLFDQYQIYRPDWLAAWENGVSVTSPESKAQDDENWQRWIWNQQQSKHRINFESLLLHLQSGPSTELPPCIHVFGVHTLPPIYIVILNALSEHHDIHLYLFQPTPEYYSEFIEPEESAGNLILQKQGRQGADLLKLMIDAGIFSSERDDKELFVSKKPDSLLEHIQHSIFHLKPLDDTYTIPQEDVSLCLHSCHSPIRELEVLYDTILQELDRKPTLSLNDIIVLSPQIDQYTPFIKSVFHPQEEELPSLAFSIADGASGAASSLLNAFIKFIQILDTRVTSNQIYELLSTKHFRDHYELDEQDLQQIRIWITETATRWGIDAAHRSAQDLPAYNDYTWDSLINGLLEGYALYPEPNTGFNPGEPYTFVEGSDRDLIGKLVDFLKTLASATKSASKNRTLVEWKEILIGSVIEPFFSSNKLEVDERMDRNLIVEILDSFNGYETPPFPFTVILSHLNNRIKGLQKQSGFLYKGITFASLTPMRTIPKKMVAILGLNSGSFPRDPTPVSFDLMKMPHLDRVGDRSSSNSDKYLFLETLLSAKGKIHLSYCGESQQGNENAMPSVVVEELKEFLSPHILPTHHHKLHSHSPEIFSSHNDSNYRSYSPSAYRAAITLENKRCQNKRPVQPLQVLKSEVESLNLTIHEFIDFFTLPSRFFAKHILNLNIPYIEEDLKDDEPLSIDSLEKYSFQISAVENQELLSTEKPYFPLAPGNLGIWGFADLKRETTEIFDSYIPDFINTLSTASKLAIAFKDKANTPPIHINGELTAVEGMCQKFFRPADIKAKDLLAAWIHHLLAAVSKNHLKTQVLGISNKRLKSFHFKTIEANYAEIHLKRLTELLRSGLSTPLPFELEAAYSLAIKKQKDSTSNDVLMHEVADTWYGRSNFSNKTPPAQNPWNILIWNQRSPAEPSFKDRFIENASSVFDPILLNLEKG